MRLYLDTSVFSAFYDQRTPERLAMTRAFWGTIAGHEMLCSQLTQEEIAHAPAELARNMSALTSGFRVLLLDDRTRQLAQIYVQQGLVPVKYLADALHIATAVLAEADVLVSWNFEHMVKRATRLLVNYINATRGLRNIEILAPPEL